MSRDYIVDRMNECVEKAKGQFNTHLYKEYCYWQKELEELDKKNHQ